MAGKRKGIVPKNGPVWRQSAEEATLARMPKYNAYACGTGAHGDAKYSRARQKQAWLKELDKEGSANRGAFPFSSQNAFGGLANGVHGASAIALQLIY